ncbi:CAP domain-containing protein [Oscillatoria sp. CS-180]|uniref:CAP domain-containing protein n=1 Tax=Oscillatoria sp. CS-180 TaxID=3021720 RepID=UPI0023312FAE|nr:CAP domain-containing protein [Oscillatoria sp. CS-180]
MDSQNSLPTTLSAEPIRIEAEAMDLVGYTTETVSGSGASGGKHISLKSGNQSAGTASGTFDGEAGTYQITVGYYDENDGISSGSLKIGGKTESFDFDRDLPNNWAKPQSFTTRVTHEAIALKPGDRFTLSGAKDRGEFARFDYVEFTPTAVDDGSTSPQPPASEPLMTFALVDAKSNKIVKGYEDLAANDAINLDGIDFSQYSIVAQLNPNHPDAASVQSVKFESPYGDRIENIEPYALFGDTDGDYWGKALKAGDYTLKATAYTQDKGKGTAISSTDLSYSIVKGTTPPDPDPNPDPGDPFKDSFMNQFDHVISHFDGNNNDRDDIAALPMAAAITYAAGFQDKSTFFYSNNLGEPSLPMREEMMQESAAFAEKLGIQTYDYQEDADNATAELVKILNSGKKVLAIEGGPMEAIYRALDQVDADKHENITLLSHSSWNENRNIANKPGVEDVRTWDDLKNDFPDVTLVEIRDQNGSGDKGFNSSKWTWLDNTSDPLLQEVRDLMKNAANKVNDPSDSGMHFYALTGNESADPLDAKAFFEEYPLDLGTLPDPVPTPDPVDPTPDPVDPTPDPGDPAPDGKVFMAEKGQLILEAESAALTGDWTSTTVEGEKSVLWDADKSSYGKVPTGQTLSYQFETDEAGSYSIALHSGRVKDVMNDSDRYEKGSSGKERTDTGNDAYVAIINAETGEVVQKPTKLFTGLGNSDQDLKWGTTFDANHKKSSAQVGLEADTQYRLEITGRSDGYVLDRITLSNDGALKDTQASQSPIKGEKTEPQPQPKPPTNPETPDSTPDVPTPTPDAPEPETDPTQNSAFEQEVVRLTNEFRQQNGLDRLVVDTDLADTADLHSENMARQDFFSHTGKDGSEPWDRAKGEGYESGFVGENIAAGTLYSTPEDVVQGWIDSPGHRANMLNPDFNEIGVGYYFLENDTGSVNYNHYWTQVFGKGTIEEPAAGSGTDSSSNSDIASATPKSVSGDGASAISNADPLMGDATQLVGDPDVDDWLTNYAGAEDISADADILTGAGGDFIPLDSGDFAAVDAIAATPMGINTPAEETTEADPFGDAMPMGNPALTVELDPSKTSVLAG